MKLRTLIFLPILAACAPDKSDMPTPDEGRMLFVQNCAGCHRNDGTGGGAWAAGLDPPPADLTALAAQGFDRTRILSVIDGYDRTGLPGHQMPEFGALMRGDSVPVELNDGSLSPVPRPLAAILTYLEAIQEEPI
ncbi:MAG: c-type cytochrome [Pseudomonadota bacterium]